MMMINTMMNPSTMIPSVEPISETSFTFGNGVVVGWRKRPAAPAFPSKAGEDAENVTAALNNARTSPSPMVMMGRTSFFISFSSTHVMHRSEGLEHTNVVFSKKTSPALTPGASVGTFCLS